MQSTQLERVIPHDNTGRPDWLPDLAYIKAKMGDGTFCYGDARDFDWTHETDPVLSFEILRWGGPSN
jgi:hypothetical protein